MQWWCQLLYVSSNNKSGVTTLVFCMLYEGRRSVKKDLTRIDDKRARVDLRHENLF